MSKHRRGKRQYTPARTPVGNVSILPPAGGAYASGEAVKTYLQEQIALMRPQVAHTEMAHLFRFSVTAWSAVGYRAEALRQVDFTIGDEAGNPIENLPPIGKAIQNAFRQNFQGLIERCEVSHCYYGASLLRRLKAPSGLLSGFQWINNNFFQLDTDHFEGLRGFRVRSVWGSELDPDINYIPTQESVYMHNIDFFEDFGGVGPVQIAYAQAATETEISATQLQFFRNMAMPSFAIQPAAGVGYQVGPDQKNELTEYMRRMYQGAANVGRTVVLPTRWEMIKFQQDFDKLGMPELTDRARDAVIRALRVPLELLEPHQSTRAQGTRFYDQKREWLISWLVPQAERYADIFSEQIAKPINPNWRIIPVFKRVRGLDEDISSRTTTVQTQVSMAVLDLYTAQQILGIKPDKNLKDKYLVGGIPVPSSEFENYHRYAPGNPGVVTGGELTTMDKPKRDAETEKAPEAPAAPRTPEPGKAIPFLPDAQYRELKAWRLITERKGAGYDFVAKALPSHAVAYGRLLLSMGGASEDAWNAIRGQAIKSYDDTENIYRTALYNLMQDAFAGNLDRKKFGIAGRDEVSAAFLNAFKNGLVEGGVDSSEMEDEEKEALRLEEKAERGYWTALAEDMYKKVIPLRDTDNFAAARDAMLGRIEQWVSKGLYRIFQLGKMYANMNGMKRFVLDGTKDHCLTCSTAHGQVHRARSWLRAGIYPRSDRCICKGMKCLCFFEDTNDRASGSIASIPVGDAAKSEDEHIEDERVEVAV